MKVLAIFASISLTLILTNVGRADSLKNYIPKGYKVVYVGFDGSSSSTIADDDDSTSVPSGDEDDEDVMLAKSRHDQRMQNIPEITDTDFCEDGSQFAADDTTGDDADVDSAVAGNIYSDELPPVSSNN